MLLGKEKQVSPVEPVATPMPSSNSNKMKQPAQQPVNDMKQIQRQRVNLVQARRRWSEWSECSVICVRTRHRLNCDDIIAQNATLLQQKQAGANSISASASTNKPNVGYTSSASKRQAAGGENASKESDDELLQRADQFEDEDYADEGDEEDDQDSCANVDTSKTLEEVPCFGGQCRLAIPSASVDHLSPAATRRPGQQLRERIPGAGGAQQTRLRHDQALHKVAPPPIYDHPVVVDANSRYHHYLQQQPHSAHRQRQPASRRNVTGTETTQFENERDYSSLSSTSLLSASSAGSNNNATSASNNSSNATSSTSSGGNGDAIWTTRNMWPQQLLNGDLGPQANLIQWTILIGSLLTIILLVMLILRKLFVSAIPSYHWMLAEQTIKSGQQLGANHGGSSSSSASLGSSGGCCRSSRRLQHHRALAAATTTTTTATTCDPNQLLLDSHPHHHQQPIVPRQLRYVWRNAVPTDSQSKHSAAALTAMPASFHQNQQQPQFIVDASGRHLLAGSSLTSAKFNTDHNHLVSVAAPYSDCLRTSPVYMDVSAAMMTNSSSSSDRSRTTRQRQALSSSSGSIQSTTAQILSNAASSSSEQANELLCELGPLKPSVGASTIACGSSGALMLQMANVSPTINSGKLRHNSAAKLEIARANSRDNSVGKGHLASRSKKQGHARRPSVPACDLAAAIKLAQQQQELTPSQVPLDGPKQVDCDNYYEEIIQQEPQQYQG